MARVQTPRDLSAPTDDADDFAGHYPLAECRRAGGEKKPRPHQVRALAELTQWYRKPATDPKGGILVLPTGGGKTFTACHFLCQHPLSVFFNVLPLTKQSLS